MEAERFDLAGAFAEHEARVFTYFRRMVPGRENARDLTQETFYRAFRDAHRFRGDAPVSAWLLGIARNVFLEWLRKHAREPLGADVDPVDPSRSPGPSPEPVDVERALMRLEREYREVLVLRFVLDLPGEEVAAILGISHDAVRQRVARAKGEFRKVWEAET